MVKCDVCGKSTLLPEKFGSINICKVCFMKINGPLWKYRTYDRFQDIQCQKTKVTESAKAQNFPPVVINALNTFFDSHSHGMIQCHCCGEFVHDYHILGDAFVCRKCFSKINTFAWKQTEYETNYDVEKNREKTLLIAKRNNFPSIVIDGINQYFDSKIQKGLIRVIHNQYGQTLKVFNTHCILITNDVFNAEEISKSYGKILRKNQPKEALISNAAAKSLAHSVLTGGIMKAGIEIAASTAINVAADTILSPKATFKLVRGSITINYHNYSKTVFQSANPSNNDIGFIKFINPKYCNDPSEDIIFFFTNNNGMDSIYHAICECIETCNPIEEESMDSSSTAVPSSHKPESSNPMQNQSTQISVADEILKFKKLLDMGAITQEEFDAKKKQLLNL